MPNTGGLGLFEKRGQGGRAKVYAAPSACKLHPYHFVSVD